MKQSFSALAALLGFCGISACQPEAADEDIRGTDTGNPYDGDGSEGTSGDSCTETDTELAPDEITPLGFAAQPLIELASGEHRRSLAWIDGNVEYGPESGVSEIVLDVQPVGAARFVDRSPRASSNGQEGGGLLAEIYSPCNDSIEIDVQIAIRTAGGALDEVVETTIEATAADFARGSFAIDLTAIEGSFMASPTAPNNTELTRSILAAQLGFTPYGSVGALSLANEFRSLDGSAVGQGGAGEIAHFPAESYCGPNAVSVTADQSVRGVSMSGALSALNAMSPATVRYASGDPAELTLSFASSVERVCAQFESGFGDVPPGALELQFDGSVSLDSNDGRIDATIPISIVARTDGSSLTALAQASAEAEPAGAAALPQQFGIQDAIDFSAYDGALVQFLASASESQAGGTLLAYGLDVADCVNNPVPYDPDSMSAPGCAGTERVPVWTALWGDSIQ